MYLNTLGERLKHAREKKRYTQIEVAEKLDISNGAISGYERNYRDPDTDTLNKLATLYDVTPNWLLGRKEKENENSPPKSKIDLIIERIEEELGVSLKDDPMILENLENTIKMYAHLKKKSE